MSVIQRFCCREVLLSVSSVLSPIDQYMAFGISGSNTRTDMIGADVVVVWVSSGIAYAVDYLLTARQQVCIR